MTETDTAATAAAAPPVRMLFALACVVAFIWIRRQVPETKGKSLEEIQQAWTEHDAAQKAPRTLPVG